MALFDTIRAGASGASADYEIDRSLRFNDDNSAYLQRTPSSDGNRTTMTLSVWIKRANFGEQVILDARRDDENRTRLMIDAGNRMQFFTRFQDNDHNLIIEGLQRDPHAWYHLIWAIDTTQSTSSNRVKMYINGEQQTDLTSTNYPGQNEALFINKDEVHAIGVGQDSGGLEQYFDGYMAEMNLIDGQQLTPSDFAETDAVTGEYKPIKYTGSYGTNGFYLNFSDNSSTSALGTDSSGNGHNFTANNFSVSAGEGNDSVTDTPTNNWATLNSLDPIDNVTFSEGNLKAVRSNAGNIATSNFVVHSGKWYMEMKYVSGTSNHMISVGFSSPDRSYKRLVRGGDGELTPNTGNVSVSFADPDVLMLALDADNGKWYIGKNGSFMLSGDPANGTGFVHSGLSSSDGFIFMVVNNTSTGGQTISANFGQQGFTYTPPTGFVAFNSQNLPEPTINKGSEHFDVLTYSGNGGSQSLTGLDFSPDWVWTKNRTGSNSHVVYDVLRGATKQLLPNLTHGETTQSDGLTSFDSGGFSSGGNGAINGSGGSYVAWCWDAGTSTVTNTDGSTSAQVRAKPGCGFSICTWTGTGSNLTIGHGLGVKPTMHITKARSGASVDNSCSWFVYFSSQGAEKNLRLQTDSSLSDTNDLYNDTEPTSSVITIGNSICINANGGTYVTYVFTDVDGYSKSGTYTGNGDSNDGTFVFTGFKIAWLMVKRTNGSENWAIWDYKREGINPTGHMLRPDSDTDEGGNVSGHFIDLLSNGFKFYNSDTKGNGNNDSYVYFAIAQRPFKIARAM